MNNNREILLDEAKRINNLIGEIHSITSMLSILEDVTFEKNYDVSRVIREISSKASKVANELDIIETNINKLKPDNAKQDEVFKSKTAEDFKAQDILSEIRKKASAIFDLSFISEQAITGSKGTDLTDGFANVFDIITMNAMYIRDSIDEGKI